MRFTRSEQKPWLFKIWLKIPLSVLPVQATCADWLDLYFMGAGIAGDAEMIFEAKVWIQNIMIYI